MKKSRIFLKLLIISILIINSIFIINLKTVSAAIITGSIYDLALQKESDAIIEINTIPKQLLVSKEGDYLFNVKPGNYTMYSYTSTSKASESIIIEDEGNYTLDIILEEKSIYFDTNNDNDLSLDEKNLSVSLDIPIDSKNNSNIAIIAGIILIIIMVLSIIFLFIYSKKHILKNNLELLQYKKDNKKKQKSNSKKKLNSKEMILKEDTSKIALKKVTVTKSNESLDKYDSMIFEIIKKDKRTTQKDIRKQVPLSEAKISLVISDLENKGMIRKIKKGRGNILIFVKD